MVRTPTKVVGLTVVGLAVVALVRVAVGLARSWAGIWEHYHREVLAGYDDLDSGADGDTDDDFDHWAPEFDGPPDSGRGDQVGGAISDALAGEFDHLARGLAGEVQTPDMVWPVDDPERPRYAWDRPDLAQQLAGRVLRGDDAAREPVEVLDLDDIGPDPRFRLGPGGTVIDLVGVSGQQANRERFDPAVLDSGEGERIEPAGTYLGGVEHLHVLAGPDRAKFTGTHRHVVGGEVVTHCHRQPHGWVASATSSPSPGGW